MTLRSKWSHLYAVAAVLSVGLCNTAAAADSLAGWQFVKDYWAKGGGTMWPLSFLSLMALAFTLERIFFLKRSLIAPAGLSQQARQQWNQGQFNELKALPQTDKSVLAQIIAFVARHRARPVSEVSTGAGEIAVRGLRPHFRRAYPLLIVSTLAPLFGLFGTVVGMMEAFENFRLLGEHGDPSVFAGSISKALVTTIVGLAISMPALASYHFFKTRTNTLMDTLEIEVSDFVTDVLMPETDAPAAAPAPVMKKAEVEHADKA